MGPAPGSLPTRYAAVYAFFLESWKRLGALSNFVEKAAKATLVGDVFDDAATGQGLLNYFLRAINCGALTEQRRAIVEPDAGRAALRIIRQDSEEPPEFVAAVDEWRVGLYLRAN